MGKYSQIKSEIVAKRQATWDSVKDVLKAELEEINSDVFESKWSLSEEIHEDSGQYLMLVNTKNAKQKFILAMVNPNNHDQISIGYGNRGIDMSIEIKKVLVSSTYVDLIRESFQEIVRFVVQKG